MIYGNWLLLVHRQVKSRDDSSASQIAALEGLARVADPTAIEPLKRYLARKTLSPGGRHLASELLEKLEKTQQ